MAWRSGHGNGGKGVPRIEVMPADEALLGVQAPMLVEASNERRSDGTFAPGASTAQRKGGRARKETTTLASRLGLGVLAESSPFRPYKAAAATFRRVHCSSIADAVGGGVCGSAPSSMVASAALQLAASRYLFDHADGDPAVLKTASALANDSRQNLLAAHELAAKEAAARARSRPFDAEAWAKAVEVAGRPATR